MTDAPSVGRGRSWRGAFAKLRSLLEFGQFATLFSERALDPAKSVRYNTALGLLLLAVSLIIVLLVPEALESPLGLLIAMMCGFGAFMAKGMFWCRRGGYPAHLHVLDGIVILCAVAGLSAAVVHMSLNAARIPENVSISHTPGIVTVGAAYGVRQILDFSGSRADRRLIRLLTLISMAAGGLLDILTASMAAGFPVAG